MYIYLYSFAWALVGVLSVVVFALRGAPPKSNVPSTPQVLLAYRIVRIIALFLMVLIMCWSFLYPPCN